MPPMSGPGQDFDSGSGEGGWNPAQGYPPRGDEFNPAGQYPPNRGPPGPPGWNDPRGPPPRGFNPMGGPPPGPNDPYGAPPQFRGPPGPGRGPMPPPPYRGSAPMPPPGAPAYPGSLPVADRKPGFYPNMKKVHQRAKLRQFLYEKKMSQSKNPKGGQSNLSDED